MARLVSSGASSRQGAKVTGGVEEGEDALVVEEDLARLVQVVDLVLGVEGLVLLLFVELTCTVLRLRGRFARGGAVGVRLAVCCLLVEGDAFGQGLEDNLLALEEDHGDARRGEPGCGPVERCAIEGG